MLSFSVDALNFFLKLIQNYKLIARYITKIAQNKCKVELKATTSIKSPMKIH